MHNFMRTSEVEYEVSHHQNFGQNQILITKIGLYPTLQDAQDAAQDALRSALKQYISKGWLGYYCSDINLEYRGLITGRVGEQQCKYLSEIRIHVREKPYEPFSAQLAGVSEPWMQASGHDPVNASLGHGNSSYKHNGISVTAVKSHPSHAHNTTLQSYGHNTLHDRQPFLTHRATESFSRTRPPYPNRPGLFVPSPSAQYDQTLSFFTHHSTTVTMEEPVPTEPSRDESRPHRYGKRKRGPRRSKRRRVAGESQATLLKGATVLERLI
jgi:hypothetical protein